MLFIFVLAPHPANCQAYREVIDAATGVRISLPPDVLGSETETRWGTNWRSADGSLEIDTIAYPEDQGLRRLYEKLRARPGRRVDIDRWSEPAFKLVGRDADGSTFLIEARRKGTSIRGFSLVTHPRGVAMALRQLGDYLSRTFDAFPEATYVGVKAQPSSTNESATAAADSSNSARTPITVQPNISDLDLDGEFRFAPDGKYLAIGSGGQIKLWDTASGRPLRILEHSAFFEQFTFIGHGAQILSVHKDGQVRIWDPATGRMLSETPIGGVEPGGIVAITLHPTQPIVVIAAEWGRRIVVWDYRKRIVRASSKFDETADGQQSAEDAALSEDGSILIAAGNGIIRRFEMDDGRQRDPVVLRAGLRVLASGMLGLGNIVATAGCDVVIAKIDSKYPQYKALEKASGCLKEKKFDPRTDQFRGEVRLARAEAKGLLYVTRRGGNFTAVIDLSSFRQSSTAGLTAGEVQGAVLAVDPSGSLAALEDGDAVRIVRLADGSLVSRLVGHGNDNSFFPVASADGWQMMLIAEKAAEPGFSVWPIEGIAPTFSTVRLPQGYVARHAVPDANVMLADDEHGNFLVLSSLTGEKIAAFSIPGMEGIDIGRLSPDGLHAMLKVSLSERNGSSALLVQTRTGTITHAFHDRELPGKRPAPETEFVSAFAFSADGRYLAAGWWGGSAEVWSTEPPRIVKKLEAAEDQTTSLTFSPDGRFLIGGSRDSGIFVWNIETGKLMRELERISVAGHVSTGGVAISHDSELVAAGPRHRAVSSGDVGLERRVHVWDLATGKLRFLLSGHEANVNALTFTSDGRWLVSGSNDGTIRYWHRRTGKLSATFAVADGRWVIITDQGFFAASSDAGDLLSVVRGFQAVSIDQLWQSLYAPDLVREHLAGDPGGEVASAALNADLQKILDSGPAPDVALVRPVTGTAIPTDLLEVEARIRDRGKGIGRIEWRVNGITAAVAAKPEGMGDEFKISRQLALDPGDNVLEVAAYNAGNLLASAPARMTVRLEQTAAAVKSTLHVLAIGINSYVDKGSKSPDGKVMAFLPLRLAVNDAKALAAALKRAGAGAYAEVRVTEALDTDASASGLQAMIERMASEIEPRDTFVLFAAAHGVSHDGRFYLIPQDYDGGADPAALKARAVGQTQLQDWLANRIKAKRSVLLLDTCESGALVSGHGRSRTADAMSDAAIGRLHEATGRPVLTAAAEGKPAFEGYRGHGVFTWALLDALHHGDRNGDSLIALSELITHVQDQVPRIAAQLEGRGRAAVRGFTDERQSARFGSRGGDFALVRRLD